MLPKKERVDTKRFNEALASGKTVFHPLFSVRTLKTKDESFKVAAVVPKAVAKGAVKRNELRRLVYNFALQSKGFFKKSTTYIIFLKKGSEKLPPNELLEALTHFFKLIK